VGGGGLGGRVRGRNRGGWGEEPTGGGEIQNCQNRRLISGEKGNGVHLKEENYGKQLWSIHLRTSETVSDVKTSVRLLGIT